MSQYPVTVWDYRDYMNSGTYANLDYGYYANTNQIGMCNDCISSIRVAPFTQVTLYKDSTYSGDRISIQGPKEVPRLGDYGIGWEDNISSIRVARVEPPMTTKLSCCQGDQPVYSCGEFQPGSAKCDSVIAQYCTAAKLSEPRCQSWCRQNPAQCDNIAVQFCNMNPDNPFCACLKSPANIKGIVNPKCVDKKCLDTGYLTLAMQNTNCPPVVDCSVKTQLDNSGVILSNTIPVQQNCGNTGVTSYVPSAQSTASQQSADSIQNITSPHFEVSTAQMMKVAIQQNIVWVFMFLIIIFAIIVGMLYFAVDDEPRSVKPYPLGAL